LLGSAHSLLQALNQEGATSVDGNGSGKIIHIIKQISVKDKGAGIAQPV
jgi:hypothetical protein